MTINKPDWETKTQKDLDNEASGIFESPILEEESLAVQELYSTIRNTIDQSNEISKSSSISGNDLSEIEFSVSESKGKTNLTITVTLNNTSNGTTSTKSITLELT
jgi:hypothetical protein